MSPSVPPSNHAAYERGNHHIEAQLIAILVRFDYPLRPLFIRKRCPRSRKGKGVFGMEFDFFAIGEWAFGAQPRTERCGTSGTCLG